MSCQQPTTLVLKFKHAREIIIGGCVGIWTIENVLQRKKHSSILNLLINFLESLKEIEICLCINLSTAASLLAPMIDIKPVD